MLCGVVAVSSLLAICLDACFAIDQIDQTHHVQLQLAAQQRKCSKRSTAAYRKRREATLAATRNLIKGTVAEVTAVTQEVEDMEQQVLRMPVC